MNYSTTNSSGTSSVALGAGHFLLFPTVADKKQSQNIYEIRKINFKIRKNISNRNVFLEIIVEEFIKSEKLIQILIKLLNPQISFCKSQTNLQIQELSLNRGKYFANPKKYFVTCYLRQQSASVRVCFRQSKMAEEWVVNIFVTFR